MTGRRVIVIGSRSQSDRRFGFSAGKQCTGNSLAFAVYSHGKSVGQLKRYDLDNILDIGNSVYEKCSAHFETETLAPEEIPKVITFQGLRYNLTTSQFRYGFIDDIAQLTFQLTNIFCTYKVAFIVCKGYTSIIKFEEGYYYLFDSHKKDKFGRNHADGKSSLIRFPDFHDMVSYLTNLFKSPRREQYDLVPLHIQSELAKTGTRDDVCCYFKKHKRNVFSFHNDVMNVRSKFPNENVDEQSSVPNVEVLNSPQIETSNEWQSASGCRKSLNRKRHYHAEEVESCKRHRSNESTSSFSESGSVIICDSDCDRSDITKGLVSDPESLSYFTSESEMSQQETNATSQKGRKKTSTEPTCKVTIRKFGNGWKPVETLYLKRQKKLSRPDEKKIEILRNSVHIPHNSKITFLKIKGEWSVANSKSSTKNAVHVTTERNDNVSTEKGSLKTNPICTSERSENRPEIIDLSPTKTLSMTPGAIRKREQRQRQKTMTEQEKARNSENRPEIIDLSQVLCSDSMSHVETGEIAESDPVTFRKPTKTLSMTPGAIRKREQRQRQKTMTEQEKERNSLYSVPDIDLSVNMDMCTDTVPMEETNTVTIRKPKANLSMTPDAIRKRAQRNKKIGETNDFESNLTQEEILVLRKDYENKRNREKQRNYRLRQAKKVENFEGQRGRGNLIGNVHFGNPCPGLVNDVEAFQSVQSSLLDEHGLSPNIPKGHDSGFPMYDTIYSVTTDTDEIENECENLEFSEVENESNNTEFPEVANSSLVSENIPTGNEWDYVEIRNFDDEPLDDMYNDSGFVEDVSDMTIGRVKLKKLNCGLEHVCVFCSKLCFPEQGSVIPASNQPKYRQYLENEMRFDNGMIFFVCCTCKGHVQKNKCPIFSVRNGICFPKKIPQLDILPHEERLIALRLPFMHIRLLPTGGQKSLRGNVIVVPADIHHTVNMLPRYLNDSGTVTVRLKRKLQYRGFYEESNVRPAKVLTALQYLIEHSPYYHNESVSIDHNWLERTLAELENSDDIDSGQPILTALLNDSRNDTNMNVEVDQQENIQSAQIESETVEPDHVDSENEPDHVDSENESDDGSENDRFSEIDQTNEPVIHDTLIDIVPQVNLLDVAPGEGNNPLYLLYDKNGEEMAFPTLYNGEPLDSIFPASVSFDRRTRWELTAQDRRIAQNIELIFYKYKRYQLHYIQTQADFAMRFVKQNKKYTVGEVLNDSDRTNIATVDNGFFFYKKLRNSPQFLQQKKRELLATIRQLGIPTFFVSLSAADTRWQVLLQTLGEIVDQKVYSVEEVENMSYKDKTRLINSDPVTCARYFDRRFLYFLKQILYKEPYPLGKIVQHFYRVEFQHRGSPHIHMIIWTSDAPKYEVDKDQSDVVSYIDKYISCSLEPSEESKPYIKFQVHKHSKTCRKGGKPRCRFHYPLPPFDETIILEPNRERTDEQMKKYKEIQEFLDSENNAEDTTLTDILHRFNITFQDYVQIVRSSISHTQVFLKRKPSECRVNMYMKNLLYVWEANMDCQFCLDPYSVVAYIVNYINKENRGLSLNLMQMTKQCERQKCNIRETVKKLGNIFANNSEVCVQECIYILLGLPLAHQSIDVMAINTAIPERRVKILKNKSQLPTNTLDSTDIFRDDHFDNYHNRPIFFKDWCFADYICRVKVTPRTTVSLQTQPTGLHTTRIGTQYYLCPKKRYSIGRRRILSYVSPSKKHFLDDYFRVQLLLFHPWTSEPTLSDRFASFQDMFNAMTEVEKTILTNTCAQYNVECIENLQDLYSDMTNDASNLVLAPCSDQPNNADFEEGTRSLTQGRFFNPSLDNLLECQTNERGEVNVNNNQTLRNINLLWPHEEICEKVQRLNDGQRTIYDHVMKHVTTCANEDQMFYLVTGGAGTGKTVLLQTLYQSLSRYYNLDEANDPSMKSVLKLSSTGKSAYLIKGQTLHGGLSIRPAKCYKFYQRLAPDLFNTVYLKFRSTKVVLFDEISMVGGDMFRFINLRLQEIKGTSLPFGGLHVICFGDFYLLPPVRDKWIFENNRTGMESLAINMWTDLFKIYELKQIMRQRDEYEFAALLNRMRVGEMTPNDYRSLQTCVLPGDEFTDNLDCLHLFSTNDAVKNYNTVCFNKCHAEKTTIQCVDVIGQNISTTIRQEVVKALQKGDGDNSGAKQYLNLGIGLTYEVNSNLNVQDGLVNGSSGILKYIQYVEAFEKPIALWFLFENEDIGLVQRSLYRQYKTAEISPEWTPIFAVTREFTLKDPKVLIRRKQFPVQQSTGKTVHKAQGCTVPEVVISLVDFHFRNAFYVACSRVPRQSKLHILNFAPGQIITDSKVHGEMCRMKEKKPLKLNFEIFPRTDGHFSVYYCNIQSLNLHYEYIKDDFIIRRSNVILFNESHLTALDETNHYLFTDFKMYRFDGNSNDHRRPFNGLAMYIRHGFGCDVMYNTRSNRYEFMVAKVWDSWNEVIFILYYVKPQTSKQEIENMFQEINVQGANYNNVCIVGDLNLNFLKDNNSIFIRQIAETYQLCYNETNFTTKKKTIIDYLFSVTPLKVNTHYLPWSHHFALTTQL